MGGPGGTRITDDEVRSERAGLTALERLHARTAAARRHGWPAGRRALPAVGAALALVAAGVALQPATPDHGPVPDVAGRSVRIPPPLPPGAAPRPIRATYVVGPSRSGTQLVVRGVTGPHLVASTVGVRRSVADDGSQVVTVSAVADCSDPAVLGRPRSGYRLAVTRREPDGSSTRARLRLAPSPVDWGAAVRQDCWQRRAASAVTIGSVEADSDRVRREVRLTAVLVSALPRDVRVAVVDVADVDTLDAADTGTLPSGGRLTLRVRLPVPDCTVAGTPATLLWSAGPVRRDPAASFVTGLSPTVRATVLDAVRRVCAPPGTTVAVTGSRVLPADPAVGDPAGARIEVHLAVRSGQPLVLLGLDPGPSATSDARRPLTLAEVRPAGGAGSAVLVWDASCSVPAPPLTVPVRLAPGGERPAWSVTLSDPALATTYGTACSVAAEDLVAAGWVP